MSELIENLLKPEEPASERPVSCPPAATRLMKAAPDLYRALKAFINPTGHTDACMELRRYGNPVCTKQCEEARRALEKATGEQIELKI
jgi:hypothetical protein